MSPSAVAPVEALCVLSVQQLHPAGEVRHGSLNDQVVVRAHQAVALAEPAADVDNGAEDLEEVLPVVHVAEGMLLVHRACGDVKDPARDLEAVRPWHADSVGRAPPAPTPWGELVTHPAHFSRALRAMA